MHGALLRPTEVDGVPSRCDLDRPEQLHRQHAGEVYHEGHTDGRVTSITAPDVRRRRRAAGDASTAA